MSDQIKDRVAEKFIDDALFTIGLLQQTQDRAEIDMHRSRLQQQMADLRELDPSFSRQFKDVHAALQKDVLELLKKKESEVLSHHADAH